MDTETRLQALEAKVKALVAKVELLSARPPGGPAQAGPTGRGAKLREFDAKWKPIAKRWPAFVVHPKSCEAFESHCEALGGEPSFERIRVAAERLDSDKLYTRADIENAFNTSRAKAAALLMFFRWSGLATWERRGIRFNR